MKRYLILLIVILISNSGNATPMPDNMYFRAMNDEMQRSLRELRLKDHPDPYLISYWIEHNEKVTIQANMGTLAPTVYDPQHRGDYLRIEAFVSVGSDQKDGLGFDGMSWVPWITVDYPTPSYDAIRQVLWKTTNEAYLRAADLYKRKEAYKQKKNIHDSLPDVIPSKPAHFIEDIPAFAWPDIPRLEKRLKEWSALGKKLPFVERFAWSLEIEQIDRYYLNSRGAMAQYVVPSIELSGTVFFRQPNGKTAEETIWWGLKDTSEEELNRIDGKIRKFLDRVEQAYGAKSGEVYIGPVLLKPAASAALVFNSVLWDLKHSKPLLVPDSDDDRSAGVLHKKRNVRVSTDLLTIYDRPFARDFQGISLYAFNPVDAEGVAAENLTLIEDGRVKEIPLTQRPLSKGHRSNGHAYLPDTSGPREGLTNVFIEPKEQLTDAQMEEKLRERCRELGLEYGYILHTSDPSGDLGVERLYTSDGRKETILNLKWDGDFFTQRDLRGALAVGGESQLANNDYWRGSIIAPSILMQEVELVPQENKPHRKPFISKPSVK